MKQWWRAPKKGEEIKEEKSPQALTSSKSDEIVISPNLSGAYEISHNMVDAAKQTNVGKDPDVFINYRSRIIFSFLSFETTWFGR